MPRRRAPSVHKPGGASLAGSPAICHANNQQVFTPDRVLNDDQWPAAV
jgi:hypothetical protein